jgi:uncharacterized coiled-coil DUF342 family protein
MMSANEYSSAFFTGNTNAQEMFVKVNTLENSHKSLITDLSRLFKNCEKLRGENQLLQENIKEYRNMCQELHKTLTLTQVC